MTKRIVRYSLLALFVGLIGYGIYLYVPRTDYFVERIGSVDTIERNPVDNGESIDEVVKLVSTTGLVVDMRVVRPNVDEKLPVVLLAGGHESGQNAVDLAGLPTGVIYAAISYPYQGSHDPEGVWESLKTVPHIQRAFLDTPPALSLAARWLAEQPWVDASRIELVGASLGVPFAAVAGAVDDHFSRVWLLHGGGDNVAWVSHLGRRHIDNESLRRGVTRFALLVTHSYSFDTLKWLAKTAPRPVVVVMACEDDYTPPEAQAPLVEAALTADHATLLWTTGRHIKSGRDHELNQLLDIVLSGVLRGELPESADCAGA